MRLLINVCLRWLRATPPPRHHLFRGKSQSRTAAGAPEYDAIVYIGWDLVDTRAPAPVVRERQRVARYFFS
jgi:hypothetical protein